MDQITITPCEMGWFARASGLAAVGKTRCEARTKLQHGLDIMAKLSAMRVKAMLGCAETGSGSGGG